MKQIKVYQVSESAPNSHFLMFSSLDMVEHLELKVSIDNYKVVWEGQVEDKGDTMATLEDVYRMLNVGQKPEGYQGHSLSVSDIILMDGKYYYTDSYGFEEIQLTVKCPTCGSEVVLNGEDTRFCEECGEVFNINDNK